DSVLVDRGNHYATLLVSSLARPSAPRRTQRSSPAFYQRQFRRAQGGVFFPHNIIGNVAQFSVMLDAGPDDSLLASLPFFHSFGCTVTLWYPLIEGTPIITYSSPLEAAKNAALVEKYKITVLLATPTFLRAYLRKAEPEQLHSARLVIVGAEKMPLDLSKKFFERFGKRVMEGYGLTETAPVVSVNLPNPIPERPDIKEQMLY